MNTQHSQGETTESKDDYASLIALFLGQAESVEEKRFVLSHLYMSFPHLSPNMLNAIRESIARETVMCPETRKAALTMIEGQLALRELAAA
jgi:hypothetical protein